MVVRLKCSVQCVLGRSWPYRFTVVGGGSGDRDLNFEQPRHVPSPNTFHSCYPDNVLVQQHFMEQDGI